MAALSNTPDLFVIADGVDPLADLFKDFVCQEGRSAERLSYPEAARLFSISRNGSVTKTTPTVPLFIRLPQAAPSWANGETHFHHAEIFSLVWGAAALSSAPVVNRPDAFGLTSRCAWSINVLLDRANMAFLEPEVYTSHPPEPQGLEEEWWIERQADGAILPWAQCRIDAGPYRASRMRSDFTLYCITVVGCQAWGDLPVDVTTDLRAMSVQICTALNITFATATWRWYASDNTAVFVRLNPFPTLVEIERSWIDVGRQLLLELSE